MTKLSVNINKFATLRNARGGNNPNLIKVAKDCQHFGADGITVHPRPDERHIRYQDVIEISQVIDASKEIEFNIEGNPLETKFIDLVLKTKPTQVTLVPDSTNQLTSNHGWDTIQNKDYLSHVIAIFKNVGIRVSIFVDPIETMIQNAAETGTDRIELYTESYASNYAFNRESAIQPYIQAALIAKRVGLELNAGHDLDLNNLAYFSKHVPNLLEVSIGHALVCDALYLGLENTIQMYKRCLK
jgi:pyridoxine 5-phosphate synthase